MRYSNPHTAVLARFAAMVANPWTGPLARGLVPDDSIPNSVLVRRRSTLTLDLSNAPTLGSGVEIAVVMNGARDPYIGYRIIDPSITTTSYVGRATEDSGLVPMGSYGRVIASGVRVTYLGTEQNRGGCLYHFSYSRENSQVAQLAAYQTWGSLIDSLGGAVTAAKIGPSGVVALVDSPETTYCEIKTQPDNLLDAGMPAPTANVSIFRCAFVGPKAGMILQFDISEVLEYFHLSHKAFSTPITNVPNGETLQKGLNSMLSTPNSGNTQVDKPGFLTKVTQTLGNLTGVATGVADLRDALGRAFGYAEREVVAGAHTAERLTGPIIEEVADVAPLALTAAAAV